MNNNYEAFVALRDKYRAITLDEIKDVFDQNPSGKEAGILTGYGDRKTCTLCQAVGYVDTDDDDNNLYPSIDCDKCIWAIATGSHCYGIENTNTFEAIDDAVTPQELYDAFQDRANRMDEVLALYNKTEKETNTTTKLESDKCPYCGSYLTETLAETVEVDELISQCHCRECGGYYDDIYDIRYNYTACTTLPPKKYRPYSKVNPEWIGKVVKSEVGCLYAVTGIRTHEKYKNFPIVVSIYSYSFEDFFKHFTWADGTPCGEEV